VIFGAIINALSREEENPGRPTPLTPAIVKLLMHAPRLPNQISPGGWKTHEKSLLSYAHPHASRNDRTYAVI
jgi:hypothetical protein